MSPSDESLNQSKGSSPRFRQRHRSGSGVARLSTSSAMLLMAVAATSQGTAAGSAFMQDARISQRRRHHFHSDGRKLFGSGDGAVAITYNRHCALRSTGHPLSTGDKGEDAWSGAFQNAIGSLHERLDIEDRFDKTERRIATNGRKYRGSSIQFVSPLLEDGYPAAVLEYEEANEKNTDGGGYGGQPPERRPKPMLLYLPGFDGTNLAPFLQFPSLGEEFDVCAMKVEMDDRSTFDGLKEAVVEYLLRERGGGDGPSEGQLGAVYLMGESFGGILATEVALELSRPTYEDRVELRGLILVNPATSYLRSRLHELGPPIANAQTFLPRPFSDVQYIISLVTQLVPLFLDRGRAVQQLIAILSSKGLPSVVNDPQREAYMGRVAFDLPNRLRFMPKDTLRWRLEEWLERGCGVLEDRLEALRALDSGPLMDADARSLRRVSRELRVVIVAGELDATLPSAEEAGRLSSEVFRNARVHVVPGAGHASTCGGSLDLMGLLRGAFPETNTYRSNACGGKDAGNRAREGGGPSEELFGLEPRYDSALIGLNPLLYWSEDYYRKWRKG